jgi:hypothetical protein
MPGVIPLFTPTAVFPASLSVAFTEAQTWPARVNEYRDGATQATAMLANVQRSWKLTKRLGPSALSTLLAFWQAQGAAAFWFYNPAETLVYDPTGVATTGRYRVRFEGAWSQSIGLARGDVPIQLVETIGAICGPATPIPGIFGTGVDDSKMALVGTDCIDPHWVMTASCDPSHPGPNAHTDGEETFQRWVNQTLTTAPGGPYGRWIGSDDYGWLDVHPLGNYTFQTTFDLTGYALATVVITGGWSADDIGSMLLNGVQVAYQAQQPSPFSGPKNPLNPFTLSGGFVPGVNTLSVVVTNTQETPFDNPKVEGLLVIIDSASGSKWV